jgi:hypothetical protein
MVFPLTVISFGIFTKWWYALPIDAPDTMFIGFPLAYRCPGWHTSLSLQIFVIEFLIDFLFYLSIWFAVIFCIDRFLTKVRPSKSITISLWTVSGLFIAFGALFAINRDNIYYVMRPFDMKVLETGYEFIWQYTERPDYYKYFPKDK